MGVARPVTIRGAGLSLAVLCSKNSGKVRPNSPTIKGLQARNVLFPPDCFRKVTPCFLRPPKMGIKRTVAWMNERLRVPLERACRARLTTGAPSNQRELAVSRYSVLDEYTGLRF